MMMMNHEHRVQRITELLQKESAALTTLAGITIQRDVQVSLLWEEEKSKQPGLLQTTFCKKLGQELAQRTHRRSAYAESTVTMWIQCGTLYRKLQADGTVTLPNKETHLRKMYEQVTPAHWPQVWQQVVDICHQTHASFSKALPQVLNELDDQYRKSPKKRLFNELNDDSEGEYDDDDDYDYVYDYEETTDVEQQPKPSSSSASSASSATSTFNRKSYAGMQGRSSPRKRRRKQSVVVGATGDEQKNEGGDDHEEEVEEEEEEDVNMGDARDDDTKQQPVSVPEQQPEQQPEPQPEPEPQPQPEQQQQQEPEQQQHDMMNANALSSAASLQPAQKQQQPAGGSAAPPAVLASSSPRAVPKSTFKPSNQVTELIERELLKGDDRGRLVCGDDDDTIAWCVNSTTKDVKVVYAPATSIYSINVLCDDTFQCGILLKQTEEQPVCYILCSSSAQQSCQVTSELLVETFQNNQIGCKLFK